MMKATGTLAMMAALAGTVNAEGWDIFAMIDCGGAAAFFPSQPMMTMAMDFEDMLNDVVTVMNDHLAREIEDYCPNMSAADKKKLGEFSMDYLLFSMDSAQMAERNRILSNSCVNPKAYKLLLMENFGGIEMPDTCTYESYSKGDPCVLEYDLESMYKFSMKIQVEKCPNRAFPALTLACNGAGCQDFLKPCSTDDDCSQGPCVNAMGTTGWNEKVRPGKLDDDESCSDFNEEWECYDNEDSCDYDFNTQACTDKPKVSMQEDVLGILEGMSMLSPGDESCNDSKDRDIGQQFISLLLKNLVPMLNMGPFQTDAFLYPKLCGIPNTQEGLMEIFEGIEEGENDTDPTTVEKLKSGTPIPNIPIITFIDWVKGRSDDAVPLLFYDCDANSQLGSEDTIFGMRMKGNMVFELVQVFADAMELTQECRDGIAAVIKTVGSLKQYLEQYYNIWSPMFFYTFLNENWDTIKLFEGVTLLGEMYDEEDQDRTNPYVKNWPSTCNLAALMAGKCEFEIVIDSMIEAMGVKNGPASIRVRFNKCKDAMWALEVDCKGQGCKDVAENAVHYPAGNKYCLTDADCGAEHLKCQKDVTLDLFPSIYSCESINDDIECPATAAISYKHDSSRCIVTAAQMETNFNYKIETVGCMPSQDDIVSKITDLLDGNYILAASGETIAQSNLPTGTFYQVATWRVKDLMCGWEEYNDATDEDEKIEMPDKCKIQSTWELKKDTEIKFSFHSLLRKLLGEPDLPQSNQDDYNVCLIDTEDDVDIDDVMVEVEDTGGDYMNLVGFDSYTPPDDEPPITGGGGGNSGPTNPGGGGTLCGAGQGDDGNNVCVECSIDTYSPANSSVCEPCPMGQIAPVGSSQCGSNCEDELCAAENLRVSFITTMVIVVGAYLF